MAAPSLIDNAVLLPQITKELAVMDIVLPAGTTTDNFMERLLTGLLTRNRMALPDRGQIPEAQNPPVSFSNAQIQEREQLRKRNAELHAAGVMDMLKSGYVRKQG